MSFTNAAFPFGFLPIVLIVHRLALLRSQLLANIVLILATTVFCLPFGWFYVALVGGSAAINVAIALSLVSMHSFLFLRGKALLTFGVVVNLGLLIAIKYLPATPVFSVVPSLVASVAALVPASISFWTFQRTMMLVDAFRGDADIRAAATERGGALRLLATNLFFPNLITGPITYFSEVSSQMKEGARAAFRTDLSVGLTLLTFGLAKKVLIADPLAAYIVDPVFTASAAGQSLLPIETAAAILGFFVQIYFDFAGYSEMALGLSRLFGITLPMNFDSPLRASSVSDFWRRWHISLTRVIARALYTPLALLGARRAAALKLREWKGEILSLVLPVVCNFLVIALWHGAKSTFIAFGIFHAIWVILDTKIRKTAKWKRFRKNTSDALRLRLGQFLTAIGLIVSFSIFRVGSMSEFSDLYAQFGNSWIGFFTEPTNRILANREPAVYLTIAFAVVVFLPNTCEFMSRYHPAIHSYKNISTTPKWARFSWSPTMSWAVLVTALMCYVITKLSQPAPFIYGGF